MLPEPGGAIPPTYIGRARQPERARGACCSSVAVALGWLVLRRTRFGVRMFAIGNDEQAARAHGVPVRRVKVGAYALSGLFAAAGGLFLSATTTAGDATAGDVFILTSIAAVVLGGISFFGGRGSALGAIAGAFVLTLLIERPLLRRDRPALPVLLPGPVPRRRRPARRGARRLLRGSA